MKTRFHGVMVSVFILIFLLMGCGPDHSEVDILQTETATSEQPDPTATEPPTVPPTETPTETPEPDFSFKSFEELDASIRNIETQEDADAFWARLEALGEMPLRFGERVVFIAKSWDGNRVRWVGNWSEWENVEGEQIGDSNLWILVEEIPQDMAILYKLRAHNGSTYFDPLNPESTMTHSIERDDVAKGSLSDDILIESIVLDMSLYYRVYTPPGYEDMKNLPVVYFTDGNGFIDQINTPTALDNFIADGLMEPVIAVFLDMRDISNQENLREQLFFREQEYGAFITNELVPVIDSSYHTNPAADARAIVGISLGGYFVTTVIPEHSSTFQKMGVLSPSIFVDPTILDALEQNIFPVQIFLSVSAFNDNTVETRLMRDILDEQGYGYQYLETQNGHSWENWGSVLDDMMIYLFPME